MEQSDINSAEPLTSEDILATSQAEGPGTSPLPQSTDDVGANKTALFQNVLIFFGAITFLFFARPVILPIFLAVVGAMTLKPLIRWMSEFHLHPAISAALVLCLLVSAIAIGFLQFSQPAMAWMNDAPTHMVQLRQRVQKLFPRAARFSRLADAVNNLGATESEQTKATTVEIKTSRVPTTFINWTGTFLAGVGETLVLLYLLLASGDLFLQKLVRVMPTFGDKKRAVEISHEVQQNITNYLFSVTLIDHRGIVAIAEPRHAHGFSAAGPWRDGDAFDVCFSRTGKNLGFIRGGERFPDDVQLHAFRGMPGGFALGMAGGDRAAGRRVPGVFG